MRRFNKIFKRRIYKKRKARKPEPSLRWFWWTRLKKDTLNSENGSENER